MQNQLLNSLAELILFHVDLILNHNPKLIMKLKTQGLLSIKNNIMIENAINYAEK